MLDVIAVFLMVCTGIVTAGVVLAVVADVLEGRWPGASAQVSRWLDRFF